MKKKIEERLKSLPDQKKAVEIKKALKDKAKKSVVMK